MLGKDNAPCSIAIGSITSIRAGHPPLVDGPEARKAVTLI